MNYKIIFLFLTLIILTPGIFSHVNLSVDPSVSNNTVYLSKNISKEVLFHYTSNYSSTISNTYRAEYDLKIYSQELKEIDLFLSKTEEYFVSDVFSSFALNIRSLNFIDQTINLRIKVSIYDSLNNLVDSDYLFLKIISNNSEYEFSDSPINKVPEYKGYSLSRDKMILLNYLDKDKISIQNHVDYSFVYDVNCTSNSKELSLDLRYDGDNKHILEVSIDNNSVQEDVFYISCYAFNKDDVKDIRTITVNYLNQDINVSDETIIEEEIIEDNKIKTFFKNIFEKLK